MDNEVNEINQNEAGESPAQEVTETVNVQAEPKPAAKAAEPEKRVVKSHKRILQGKVTSNKPDKTIIVAVQRQVAHPLYKKYYKRTNRFMAHDETNQCNEGDIVRIRETRPLSARKRWELVEIVERAK